MSSGSWKVGLVRNILLRLITLAAMLAVIAGVFAQGCFPQAEQTSLKLDSATLTNPAGAAVSAYIYTSDPGSAQTTPVPRGLLIVDWGFAPNQACYMVTGPDGKASADFIKTLSYSSAGIPTSSDGDYPDGGSSLTYTVTFCPYAANHDSASAPDPSWMANCARLKDANGKTITRLDYSKDLKPCPGSAVGTPYTYMANGEEKDYGAQYQPSTSFITVHNNNASTQSVTFCWGLAFMFGLLVAAMFAAGRNPLLFLDLGAGRNVRMNRSAGGYMGMTKNVTVNPEAVASAADRLAGTAKGLATYGDEKKNAEKKLEDAKSEKTQAQNEVSQAYGDVYTKGESSAKIDSALSNYQNADMKVKNAEKMLNDVTDNHMDRSQAGIAAPAVGGLMGSTIGGVRPFSEKNLDAAKSKLADAQTDLDKAQKELTQARGGIPYASKGSNNQIDDAQNKIDLTSFKLGQVRDNLDALAGKPNVFSLIGNTLTSSMVKGVAMAVPNMVRRRKNTLKSAGEQARDIGRGALKDVGSGLIDTGLSQWMTMKPVEGETIAQQETRSLQTQEVKERLGRVAKVLYNKGFDHFLGKQQPPRLSAMHGWGNALGLSIESYLTSPMKSDDAWQREIERRLSLGLGGK